MVSPRQLRWYSSVAEPVHGKHVTRVRFAVPAPDLLLWPTYKGTCPVSRLMLVGIQPAAPDLMAGLAEWLRRWIVAPATRVRFSHLAPNVEGSAVNRCT